MIEKFRGDWGFSRHFSTGERVIGSASFRMIEAGLLYYREQGVLKHASKSFNIFQDYFYHFESASNKIKIFFSVNGQMAGLFLELILQDPRGDGVMVALGNHQCKMDHYQATYQFDNKQLQFCITFKVNGPQKDYVATTRYLKVYRINFRSNFP